MHTLNRIGLRATLVVTFWICVLSAGAQTLPKLRVSPDGRHLVKENGEVFLYLSDTAWELFHRTDREQARTYLDKRLSQKFTVIHAVALAEPQGVTAPNVYGDLPLVDGDPARPAVTPGANPKNAQAYDYWDHVDFIVNEANRRGLYVAFLPTWASWVYPRNGTSQRIGAFPNAGTREFTPQYEGLGSDWVLVLDDASKNYPAPGRVVAGPGQ